MIKNTTEHNKNINQLVNNRLQTYRLQGLDEAGAYARVTGELVAIIDIGCRESQALQQWVNISVNDSVKALSIARTA